jgi:hypothetical protein
MALTEHSSASAHSLSTLGDGRGAYNSAERELVKHQVTILDAIQLANEGFTIRGSADDKGYFSFSFDKSPHQRLFAKSKLLWFCSGFSPRTGLDRPAKGADSRRFSRYLLMGRDLFELPANGN